MKDKGIIRYANESARKKYEGREVVKNIKCQKCQIKQIVEKNYITSEIKEEEINNTN